MKKCKKPYFVGKVDTFSSVIIQIADDTNPELSASIGCKDKSTLFSHPIFSLSTQEFEVNIYCHSST